MNAVRLTGCLQGAGPARSTVASRAGNPTFLTRGLCFLRLRELEKQRENTATDILQKKQEAEAAVSAASPAPSQASALRGPECGPAHRAEHRLHACSHPFSSTFLRPGLWGACFTPCRLVSGALGLGLFFPDNLPSHLVFTLLPMGCRAGSVCLCPEESTLLPCKDITRFC